RYDSLMKITRTMGGAALSGAVPTPTLELAKQLGISIADAWMCFDIYKTYFDKDLSKQDLARMLKTTGVIVLGGGLAGYVGIRLAQALLSEILEQIPIANSIITGIAFGSSTFIIGLAWLAIVEQSYFARDADEA
ncbi:MAG: hypothetical protein OXG68_12455, partial [Chloroflexi bacterium]|nr:hypothetical protein [Chloroflexota bacterium]